MVRTPPVKGEKPVHWVGSSKSDLLAFPEAVRSEMGYAPGLAQLGGKHPAAKPWKGEGPGVFEVVERFDNDAYRAIYTVRLKARFTSCTPSRRSRRRAFGRPNRTSIW